MLDQTSHILNEIFESEKFIEAYTLHFKNFKENIRQSKKSCQRNVDENKGSTI